MKNAGPSFSLILISFAVVWFVFCLFSMAIHPIPSPQEARERLQFVVLFLAVAACYFKRDKRD